MEIIEILLGFLDAFLLSADVVTWIKGKDNRLERKEARKAGLEAPPRDRWNWSVIVLTALFGIVTLGLLIWKL